MDKRNFRRLWRDGALGAYIIHQAIRHFSAQENREDAIAEAWEKVMMQPVGQDQDYYKRISYNAINAMYKRIRRRSKKECPQSDIQMSTDIVKGEKFGATLSVDELVKWMQDDEVRQQIEQAAWEGVCNARPFVDRDEVIRLANIGSDEKKRRIRIKVRRRNADRTPQGMS